MGECLMDRCLQGCCISTRLCSPWFLMSGWSFNCILVVLFCLYKIFLDCPLYSFGGSFSVILKYMHSLGYCSGCAFLMPELVLAVSPKRPELAVQLCSDFMGVAMPSSHQNCSLRLQFWSARTAGMTVLCCRNGQHRSGIPGYKRD